MTSSHQEPICWRAASPCPLPQTSSGHPFPCQAWFRCERAGDYVIRWRCETLEDEALNFTGTALLLCRNQSESWQVTQCPPPVVCSAGNYNINTPVTSSTTSTEITIIVALAAFAVFALVLIVVSSYKYWAMRKRYRTQKRQPRHQPRHFMFRDYRFPMSYHNFWGPGLQQNQFKGPKTSHTSKLQASSSQPDVYFSRPQESGRYFEHLLTSSDDSIGNNYISRHARLGQVSSKGDRLKVDPTVATESFVYHNPMRSGNIRDANRGTLDWFYQNKLVNSESEERENSVECYHIYKGNIGSFRAQKQNHDNRNWTHSRNEYHHVTKSNTEFVRGGLVSSIPIPGFSVNNLHDTNTLRECMDLDLQLVDDKRGRHVPCRQVDSDSSCEGKSQYAHYGVVSKSRNSNLSNIISGEMQHNNRLRQNMNPSSSKVQRTTTTPRTSPDVISSHNFTNRFVRIGKNIYRPVLTKSPSGSSLTSSVKNNYLDISYDSFLNEHIQEYAHRGGASSSTFEAGNDQPERTNHRTANNRY